MSFSETVLRVKNLQLNRQWKKLMHPLKQIELFLLAPKWIVHQMTTMLTLGR